MHMSSQISNVAVQLIKSRLLYTHTTQQEVTSIPDAVLRAACKEQSRACTCCVQNKRHQVGSDCMLALSAAWLTERGIHLNIYPARGRVHQAAAVQRLRQLHHLLRVILAPALVEHHPHHNAGEAPVLLHKRSAFFTGQRMKGSLGTCAGHSLARLTDGPAQRRWHGGK